MKKLALPPCDLSLTRSGEHTRVYDIVRRKYVVLTPEEWVRQHVIHYLIYHRHYPKGLMSVEHGTRYHSLHKRTDLIVYGHDGRPLLLVECKSASVSLSPEHFAQLAMYNHAVGARFLLLTNGIEYHCVLIDPDQGLVFLDEIPDFRDIAT